MKKGRLSLLAYASKRVSEANVNSACMWFAYQPIIPEEVVRKCKK